MKGVMLYVVRAYGTTSIAADVTSWFGFAQAFVEQARRLPDFSLTLNKIRLILTHDYPTPAQRPPH